MIFVQITTVAYFCLNFALLKFDADNYNLFHVRTTNGTFSIVTYITKQFSMVFDVYKC